VQKEDFRSRFYHPDDAERLREVRYKALKRPVMADLHRAGRFDRMSDEVLMLTGQPPLSVQELVRNNTAAFTTQATTMASA